MYLLQKETHVEARFKNKLFAVLSFYDIIVKEVQIVYRLFLVNCYLLHVPRLPSQPARNVRGLVIH